MSFTVFATVMISVIVLGWIGFLIIAVALVRDSADAVRRRGRRVPTAPSKQGGET